MIDEPGSFDEMIISQKNLNTQRKLAPMPLSTRKST
jgi:hypothetical protein